MADERGLPVGTSPVAGSALDFSAGRPIGPARLDNAFTDLARDSGGWAVVKFSAGSEPWHTTRLWMDNAYTHVMMFSGDTLADASRRRHGLAVEPMTCAPDMLHNGFGRIVLEEGDTFEASWGLDVS